MKPETKFTLCNLNFVYYTDYYFLVNNNPVKMWQNRLEQLYQLHNTGFTFRDFEHFKEWIETTTVK